MQRNSQNCREIHRNAEKCREMHRYAEKFRKMQRNLKNLVEIGAFMRGHCQCNTCLVLFYILKTEKFKKKWLSAGYVIDQDKH